MVVVVVYTLQMGGIINPIYIHLYILGIYQIYPLLKGSLAALNS